MKPLKSDKQTRSHPSRTWKKKYDCHNSKGEHEWKLTMPKFAVSLPKYKDMTAEQYYEERLRTRTHTLPMGYYYTCQHCYKITVKFEKRAQ